MTACLLLGQRKSLHSLSGRLCCSPLNKKEIIITGCNLTALQVNAAAHWFWDLTSITTTLLSEKHLALFSVAETVKARIKFSEASTREMKETFTIIFNICKCNLFSVPSWQLGECVRSTCSLSTVSTLFETVQLQSKYISFIYLLISPHFYARKCIFKRTEHVVSVSVWVFSWSGFLSQSKNMHISLIGDPKFLLGMSVSGLTTTMQKHLVIPCFERDLHI